MHVTVFSVESLGQQESQHLISILFPSAGGHYSNDHYLPLDKQLFLSGENSAKLPIMLKSQGVQSNCSFSPRVYNTLSLWEGVLCPGMGDNSKNVLLTFLFPFCALCSVTHFQGKMARS